MSFTQNSIPTFPKQPQAGRVIITVAETTAPQTLYTAGANGSKIMGMWASGLNSSIGNIQVSITNSAVQYNMWVVAIPITSGQAAVTPASVNLMNAVDAVGLPVDNDGNPFFHMISGDTLTVNAVATLVGGNVTVHCIASDF
jgi:hypothetical protein